MAHNGIQNLASGLNHQAQVQQQAPAKKEGLGSRLLKWAGLKVDVAGTKNNKFAKDGYSNMPDHRVAELGLNKLEIHGRLQGKTVTVDQLVNDLDSIIANS